MTGERYSPTQINWVYQPVIKSVLVRITGVSFPKGPYNLTSYGRVPKILFPLLEVKNGA